MSPDLLECSSTAEAYSDYEWQRREAPQRRTFGRSAQAPASFLSRRLIVKFGQDVLEFDEQPPGWLMTAIERITSLGKLRTNWDSYGARPVDPRCAVAAIDFLLVAVSESMPLPSVVPTSRGGIQLEWHCNGIDLEIEFSSPTKIRLAFEDLQTGATDEQPIRDDYWPVAKYLQRLSKANSSIPTI